MWRPENSCAGAGSDAKNVQSHCLQCSPFSEGGPLIRRSDLPLDALFPCNGCSRPFALSEYGISQTRRGWNKRKEAFCSSCRRINRTKAHRAIKAWAVLFLGGACASCGYAKNLAALSFHHVGGKDFAISSRYSLRDIAKLEAELRKCVLLCVRCHTEEHHPELEIVDVAHIEALAATARAASSSGPFALLNGRLQGTHR